MQPTRNRLAYLAVLLVLAVPFSLGAKTTFDGDTHHPDHQNTPKLLMDPVWQAPAGLSAAGLADQFVAEHLADFELTAGGVQLQRVRVQESLLGRHFLYQQRLHGIDVQAAEVIVSIAKADGRIYRVFNNSYRVKVTPAAPGALLGEEAAYDAAWNRLRAHGDLMSAPAIRLVYTPENDRLRLNYIVDLDLTAPYGGWRLRVDAATGQIVSVEDTRLMRVKNAETEIPVNDRIGSYTGPLADRRDAFARFADRSLQDAGDETATPANGTGIVFDPDPRTTLMDDTLQDNTPASTFVPAYITRDLLDIDFSGGVYQLNGPWVRIVDWDPPSTPPSTTTDGNWTATRGNNAFNDAITYFQVDQNQRYMQSLGFSGANGIQEGSIVADTDGVNGADNSYYQPGANRMSFGHGCVDDDEDADVILHEYGHAINHSINSSWGGGDMGAIGEGFGDYWAGSYSYSTPNGPDFHPAWVFTWDGHNYCWPGRVMDAHGAQYDHSTIYGAHQTIPGGYQSDELWSTPLFQSLITLIDLGQTREEVDTIILESQFGLGGGLKMRDMANVIIATAAALYPDGPHASIFIEKFLVHNIILAPRVDLQIVQVLVNDSGTNGAADPGETVQLTVRLANIGSQGAELITADLSTTTPLVTVQSGSSAYPNLPMGQEGDNEVAFVVALDPAFNCGDPIDFRMDIDFTEGGNPTGTVRTFELGTGVPQGVAASANPELAIPDNNSAGIYSQITVSGTGASVGSNLNVDINITHTWIGDLRVRLRSPSGTEIFLHDRTGGSAHDIIGNYPETLDPAEPLTTFLGEPLDGTWTLTVSDHAGQDTGTLHSWGLNDIQGYECEEVATAVGGETAPARFAVFQNQPNPFNPATAISFEVPQRAGRVSLEVFDLAGHKIRTLVQDDLPSGRYNVTWHGVDDHGRSVGSGVYFYRLQGRDFQDTRKMMLLQ